MRPSLHEPFVCGDPMERAPAAADSSGPRYTSRFVCGDPMNPPVPEPTDNALGAREVPVTTWWDRPVAAGGGSLSGSAHDTDRHPEAR